MKYLALLLFVTSMPVAMAASAFEAVEKKLRQAMQAEVRGEADKARDRNRDPVATLKFMGLKENMKVVELIPGGGWYTKLLAPVLADEGELIVALGTKRVEEKLLGRPGFEKVKVTARESELFRPEGARFYKLNVSGFDVKNADMVLTFRNYHNFDEAGRRAMNEIAYKALRKNGIYGVVDHTRRHMEPETPENRRRIDPVLVIREVQAAGFEFVNFTDLHYRPDDELRYEVGRRSVTGNTDRFTFLFKRK